MLWQRYTRSGERITPQRDYQYIYRLSYTAIDKDEEYGSYAIASYNFKGDIYHVILDSQGKEIMDNIRLYQVNDKYMLYSKGFKTYILNLETMENVYTESDFNNLSKE